MGFSHSRVKVVAEDRHASQADKDHEKPDNSPGRVNHGFQVNLGKRKIDVLHVGVLDRDLLGELTRRVTVEGWG